ncbi:MAG: bifunctional DNA-formamidopyrimidine glycosylase/DNA-(apurinic or apyrimidinic site) lyase [Pseudomonadota bacterium]
MPELPEVETVRRGLEPAMAGCVLEEVTLRRKNLRFPFPKNMAQRLKGKRVESLTRRAKYILARIEGGEILLMHLGMSGRFTIHQPNGEVPGQPGQFHYQMPEGSPTGDGPHDHVIFQMADGTRIVYTDHRRFGIMDLFSEEEAESHKLLGALGVEPMGNALTADYLNEAFRRKHSPLKAALLDQKIVAGLGNIYVCEALFRAGLSPKRLAHTITSEAGPTPRVERLVRTIRDVIGEAIEAGGSTLRDYAQADGELGYFQHSFQVYDQEGAPCCVPGCRRAIKRIVQSGRSTFYCPSCQK